MLNDRIASNADDECSHISRIYPVDSDFYSGCCVTFILAIIILVIACITYK